MCKVKFIITFFDGTVKEYRFEEYAITGGFLCMKIDTEWLRINISRISEITEERLF